MSAVRLVPITHSSRRKPVPSVIGTLINTHRSTDGSVVVDIRGEIDVASADRLCRILIDAATRLRPTRVVVDLLYLTFIDSTGIGALVAGRDAARSVGCGFTLRHANSLAADRLRQTGVYTALTGDR
jgi:anti-sigma B factor antagonist